MPRTSSARGSALYELASAKARPQVLLAEDDPAFRQLIATALRRDGFEVAEARDGRELVSMMAARIQCGAGPYDLIITDLRMPVMSGLDALAGLQAADWVAPIIVITAFGDEQVRRQAERLGAGAMFSKPFDLCDLRTAAIHFARS